MLMMSSATLSISLTCRVTTWVRIRSLTFIVLLLVYRKICGRVSVAGAKSLPHKTEPQRLPGPRSSQEQEEKAAIFLCVGEECPTDNRSQLAGALSGWPRSPHLLPLTAPGGPLRPRSAPLALPASPAAVLTRPVSVHSGRAARPPA